MIREKRVPFLVPQAGESTGYIRVSSGLGQNADGVVYKNEVEFRFCLCLSPGKPSPANQLSLAAVTVLELELGVVSPGPSESHTINFSGPQSIPCFSRIAVLEVSLFGSGCNGVK
jgi:hypothetical protein